MEPAEETHRPVLLGAAVAALAIRPQGVYVDGTFGRGGHSHEILRRLAPGGRLIALDRDPQAFVFAKEIQKDDERFTFVDGILLDLGVSSPQLDQPERGFSFLRDGPLDMRMDPDAGPSAADWLARADTDEIADVLRRYGEERHARRIARAIVGARREAPILTTGRLAQVVSEANPAWERHKHPATRSFQAIRIYINGELEELQRCLDQVVAVLAPAGRLVVISFHSLEDRLVKRFMRRQAQGDDFPPGLPVTQAQLHPRLRLVGRAIRADVVETAANPRARSAVWRVAERLS